MKKTKTKETQLQKLGALIKKKRAALGWTQTDLANAIGDQQSTVASVEAGRRNLSIEVLERYAAALNCELIIKLMDNGRSKKNNS